MIIFLIILIALITYLVKRYTLDKIRDPKSKFNKSILFYFLMGSLILFLSSMLYYQSLIDHAHDENSEFLRIILLIFSDFAYVFMIAKAIMIFFGSTFIISTVLVFITRKNNVVNSGFINLSILSGLLTAALLIYLTNQ